MRKRRVMAAGGIAVMCLGAGSCSTTREIAVTGTLESPVITFSEHGGKPKRVCLDQLSVYESDAPAPRSPVWEIGDVETECVEVTSVSYGRVPGGIPTNAGPVALKANTEYEFSGRGWTRGMPNIPWYGGGAGARVIFRDGSWHPASGGANDGL